jgi:hypothetical protein
MTVLSSQAVRARAIREAGALRLEVEVDANQTAQELPGFGGTPDVFARLPNTRTGVLKWHEVPVPFFVQRASFSTTPQTPGNVSSHLAMLFSSETVDCVAAAQYGIAFGLRGAGATGWFQREHDNTKPVRKEEPLRLW